MRALLLFVAGVGGGLLAGMGMGGGTLLIPLLTVCFGVSQKAAQGINMLCFIPAAFLALRIHKKEGRLERGKYLTVIVFGIVGAAAGAVFVYFVQEPLLKKAFGCFLIAMAAAHLKR